METAPANITFNGIRQQMVCKCKILKKNNKFDLNAQTLLQSFIAITLHYKNIKGTLLSFNNHNPKF